MAGMLGVSRRMRVEQENEGVAGMLGASPEGPRRRGEGGWNAGSEQENEDLLGGNAGATGAMVVGFSVWIKGFF